MNEVWAPVPGWEGFYEASSAGRVRSVTRVVVSKIGIPRKICGKIKSPRRDGRYMWVTLNRDGLFYKRSVHTLVLEAFCGLRPENEMECLHRNGDGTDNRLANLRWGTKSENRIDAVEHGTHRETRKTHCPHGHRYESSNIYWRFVNGRRWRNCRTCILERQRNARRRRIALDGVR